MAASISQQLDRLETEMRQMAMPVTAISELVAEFRSGAAKAHEAGLPVIMAMPPHIALVVANRLEISESHLAARAKVAGDMGAIVETAEEAMKDEVMRFQCAVTDLEILLFEFIGRPSMTMQEVRDQRTQFESRSAGPQPFHRQPRKIPISEALHRSVRTGKIGDPREPGQEG